MVFITGDTHGDFRRIARLCKLLNTSIKDTVIILGDSGLNYFTDVRSNRFKIKASSLPITFFCVHGNHEERASNIKSYKPKQYWKAKVLVEDEFPNLKFTLDGEVYSIPTREGIKQSIVIGGAYSVDKFIRLDSGNSWFPSEQPSEKIKSKVEKVLSERNQQIDLILSHTCPYRYIPYEWFLGGIDQSSVDNSTEIWLDNVLDRLVQYEKWYCGHYHGDKVIDKLEFMFESIKEL